MATRPRSGPRPHVQTLSDMMFSLALSLGALVLISQLPQTPTELYAGLGLFGFSFLILVTVWSNYSRVMSVLPVETEGLIILNLLLLFVVAVEPYLLNVVAYQGLKPVGEAASVLYGVDLAVMNMILGGFVHVLSREEKALVPSSLFKQLRRIRDVNLGFAAVFLISVLPVFWTWMWLPGIPSRFVLWILTLPVGWSVRVARR